MEGKRSKYNIFHNLVEAILFMFVLSLPISKAGINLFGALFVLLTLGEFFIKRNKKEIIEFYRENRLILGFFFLFFLGIIVSILSDGGLISMKKYITKHLYFLMIPGFITYISDKNRKILIYIFCTGLLIGIFKSFEVFYNEFGKVFEPWVRVHSFYDVGRWGAILLFSLVMIIPFLSSEENKKTKKYLYSSIVIILGIISLILSNSRGPWIALVISIVIYFLSYDRKKIKHIVILNICFVLVFFSLNNKEFNSFKQRIKSIGNFKDISNMGRMLMWREGLLFSLNNISNKKILVGTGIENFEKPFEKYLVEKNELDILREKSSNQFSLSDNHNSFLNILNQLGIIYFIGYMYFVFNLFVYFIKNSFEKDKITAKSISLLLLSFFVCGMFYSYSISYEMYMMFFFVSFGYKSIEK